MTRDLRKYARQSNVKFAIGAFAILFGVGLVLIWIFYGGAAASLGFMCMLAGLAPIVLILLVFLAADWILKHAGRE